MLDIATQTPQSPFPQDSKLYFRVVERRNAWLDKHGKPYEIDKQKSLVRATDDGPVWLANVGENYNLLENRVLFPHCEQKLMEIMNPKHLRRVTTRESMAYHGRDCYREYIFHDLHVASKPDVAFKLSIGNGYGSKAVTFMHGADDAFCSNGMIWGTAEKTARKHTSGLTLNSLDQFIMDSMAQFHKGAQRIEQYDNTPIDMTKEDALFEHLIDKGLLSEQRARDAARNMHLERNRRTGRDTRPTLWHLYSSLTDWASHADVRDTGNDHEANTRIQRTQHAERVIRAANDFVTA